MRVWNTTEISFMMIRKQNKTHHNAGKSLVFHQCVLDSLLEGFQVDGILKSHDAQDGAAQIRLKKYSSSWCDRLFLR